MTVFNGCFADRQFFWRSVISYLSHAPLLCYALFLPHGRAPTLQDTSFAPGYVLGRYGIASIYQHESWNTPMDKAHTTYSDLDSIQNQQFRDTSLANTWIQDDTPRFYSSSSDPVATWTYDTLNDHGTFLFNGSPQIQTPSDLTFFHGSDGFGMLSDSNGHYYDAWVGSYDAPGPARGSQPPERLCKAGL